MTDLGQTDADFFVGRRAFLAQLHKQIWKVAAFVLLPAIVGVNVHLVRSTPCWQSSTLLAGSVFLGGCWLVGHWRSQQGQVGQAVALLAGSSILHVMLVLLLREGGALSAMIALFVVFAYLTLFSDQALKIAVAVSGPLFVGGLVAVHLGLVKQMPQSEGRALLQGVLYVALFFPAIAYFLRSGQRVNQGLYREAQENLHRNREVLTAVERAQPDLDHALAAIAPMASAFAVSASEQATTSAEMSASVERVGRMVADTAAAAAETRGVAERIRDDAAAGREKLRSLEAAFQGAVRRIEGVRGQMDELAEEVSRTEEVNRAIHDIAESLSVMGINASLEAAKAGEQGKGFGVVAQALGRMVAQTNTDLQSANKMLDHLRQRASRVAKDADASTAELHAAYDGLVAVSNLLEGITTSFANASASVQVIAGAAEQQRAGIAEIASGVRDLAQVAGQLSEGGRGLSEGMTRVQSAHLQLRAVLQG